MSDDRDWGLVLRHLLAADAVLGFESFGEYVDVTTAGEALTDIIDQVKQQLFESAGPREVRDPGEPFANSQSRIINGQVMSYGEFLEYWDQQHGHGQALLAGHVDRHFCPTSGTWLTYCRESCTACCEPERATPCPTIVGPAPG